MNMKDKIFTTIVEQQAQRTAAQLAARLGTTEKTVAARISEIRDEGYVINTVRKVDTKGRVKYFYKAGQPSRQHVRAARMLEKVFSF